MKKILSLLALTLSFSFTTLMSEEKTDALKKGDKVEIKIKEEKDAKPIVLEVIPKGDAAGDLQFPYIGLVKAEGLTTEEVATNAKKELEKGHFKTATVSIRQVK